MTMGDLSERDGTLVSKKTQIIRGDMGLPMEIEITSRQVGASHDKRRPDAQPRLSREIVDTVVDEGDVVVFDCRYYGYPSPRVTWYREDEEVVESERCIVSTNENESQLVLCDVSVDDIGKYRAKLTNHLGEVETLAHLTVHAKDPNGNVELYQPFEADQITLPERAQCLAVKAFLVMCDINFRVMERRNAEQMSPTGVVPFIRVKAEIFCGFESVLQYVSNKGLSLSDELSGVQGSDMKAYMLMCISRLYCAEVFLAWNVEETADSLTKPRYSRHLPWPLSRVMSYFKQREVRGYLKAHDWHDLRPEQVYHEVNVCCKALSDKLADRQYFFTDRPTELDALVYGHLKSLLTHTDDKRLADTVNRYPTLVQFCDNITNKYFTSQRPKCAPVNVAWINSSSVQHHGENSVTILPTSTT